MEVIVGGIVACHGLRDQFLGSRDDFSDIRNGVCHLRRVFPEWTERKVVVGVTDKLIGC